MAISASQRVALQYFTSQGWTQAQAAGIVANLTQESGLNPKAFNGAGGGQGAQGVAQWRGNRLTNFQTFAGHPMNQSTLEEQLAFVNYELTQGVRLMRPLWLTLIMNAVAEPVYKIVSLLLIH